MLVNLSIKNYALIEDISLDFNSGLTVITGETGSGKSIIIEAVDLLLGARADLSSVRTGAGMCTVVGTFNIESNINIKNILDRLAIDYSNDILIVRRSIENAGKSRAFINDVAVSISSLSEIGRYLIDFHGQHQSNMLFEESYQRKILDGIAGTKKNLDKLELQYDVMTGFQKQKETLLASISDKDKMADLYKFQINEITKANLNAGDDILIEKELPKLKNSEKIKNISFDIVNILYKQDNSVLENLSKVSKCLDSLEQFGLDTKELSKSLDCAYNYLDDIYREIDNIDKTVNISPEDLNLMIEKQQLIKKLKTKYGSTINDIIDYKNGLMQKIERLDNSEYNLERLDKEIDASLKQAEILCSEISEKRQKAAKNLSKDILKELKDLNMRNADFKIDLTKQNITKSGFDKIEFLFSANTGENLFPLSVAASGGELSRILLAVSAVISKYYDVSAVVFDEIDMGTSGHTGEKIGKKLKIISENKQVFSISHLAQVASAADTHIKIYKEVVNNRSITKAKVLDNDEHIKEVAKIISGEKLTQHAIDHARELISGN